MTALEKAGAKVEYQTVQEYRLAGLLHDIGHYPLSHALERPVIKNIQNRQAEALVVDPGAEEGPLIEGPVPELVPLDHERVGAIVLEEDPELQAVLREADIDPEMISNIFTRTRISLAGDNEPDIDPLTNLVSSDLDADRIDFLLRTSQSTGLPYGAVDLDYVLSQITLDRAGRVCLHERALRTADHLLLARFFDTQQVAYHKTVAVLEELAKDIVSQLPGREQFEIDELWIRHQVQEGTWDRFNDAWLMREFEKWVPAGGSDDDELLHAKIQALLQRRPPKLVASDEYFGDLTEARDETDFNLLRFKFEQEKTAAAEHFGLDERRFYLWTKRGFRLSKMGSSVPIDDLDDEELQREKREQCVRILPRLAEDGLSREIMSMPSSLMSILSNRTLNYVRLYLLEPSLGVGEEVRAWLQTRLY